MRRILGLEEAHQLLQLLVEARRRSQAHHGERARGLVQVREDVLDRSPIRGIGGELVERLSRLVERVVDLGLHPCERAEIEIGDRVGSHLESVGRDFSPPRFRV